MLHLNIRTTAGILAIIPLLATTRVRTEASDSYKDRVVPFLRKYCVQCHGADKPRGELNLRRYQQAPDVTRDFRRWDHIVDFIRGGKMPPEDATRQPSITERNAVVRAIEAVLLAEARKHAGDPGVVLPRRLSNTEYDLSIRDLTGIDIRPTKEFPTDPAAGEGFDNTGEALTMSPSLLKKYLGAAENVANHLVLKPRGLAFAPFPVTSYNERKKLTEQAIIAFYQRHEVRISDYLESAWRYRHRQDRSTGIQAWARQHHLSERYLRSVWDFLNATPPVSGFLRTLHTLWNAIPAPIDGSSLPPQLRQFNDYVEFWRRKLCPREPQLIRSNAGNWPISHLDFRDKTAERRDRFQPASLTNSHLVRFDRIRAKKDKPPSGLKLYLRVDRSWKDSGDTYVILHQPLFSRNGNLPRNAAERTKHEVATLRSVLERHAPRHAQQLGFGVHPAGRRLDADSIAVKAPALIEIPLNPSAVGEIQDKHLLVQCELDSEDSKEGSAHIRYAAGHAPQATYDGDVALLIEPQSQLATQLSASADRFCRVFPNRFFYVDNKRGLAAGFHLVEGFFRDDRPLMKYVLDERQQTQLNQLWDELEFVTQSSETLIRGFVWFERSERHVLHDKRFDFLRPEDPLLVEHELLGRFERVYLGKMGITLIPDTLKPQKPSAKYDMIHGFFEQIRHGLAQRRTVLKAAERNALQQILEIASRAYRRTLRPGEVASLRSLYHTLRNQGQEVEDSLRGVFTAILMSPEFSYRYWESPAGANISPLSDAAMASRLSYFLWSSLPDDALLSAAKHRRLSDQAALIDQTRRMIRDPKIEAFAREFFGQWLRYRDYLTNDPIIAETFSGYTAELRQAMFEEPTRLATYLIQQDKPITDLLDSDVTFVNAVLAKHYGGTIAKQYDPRGARWQQIKGLRQSGRGGLLGMPLILTKNSGGQRTSPVKRGFWVVHHLLGQHFPPPPVDVPDLPPNEKVATKTIRELIAEHTANRQCAICHVHFDSLGMALEGFDPIGRLRTKDLAGRPIDNVAEFPSGQTAQGLPGLIEYLEQHRREDFARTLCRKFLGYALGRSVSLSDTPLLLEMESALQKNDYRFSVLFEMVVQSSQFRKQRGREFSGTPR